MGQGDAVQGQAQPLKDPGLYRAIGEMLVFEFGGGLDFDDSPAVALGNENVEPHEYAAVGEGRLEDRSVQARPHELGGVLQGLGEAWAVLDQDPTALTVDLTREVADLVTGVERRLGLRRDLPQFWVVNLEIEALATL